MMQWPDTELEILARRYANTKLNYPFQEFDTLRDKVEAQRMTTWNQRFPDLPLSDPLVKARPSETDE